MADVSTQSCSTAFFKLAAIIPEEEAIDLMKAAAKATYGRKGDKIVQMNYDAIDAGAKQVVEVDGSGELERRS